jgi:transcriptional regulator with XRE-family HTH domain
MKKAIKNPIAEPEPIQDDFLLRLDGEFLKYLMNKYNISQRELSKKTGISRTKISNLLESDYIDEIKSKLIQKALEDVRGESFDFDEERGLRKMFDDFFSNTLNDENEPEKTTVQNTNQIPKVSKKYDEKITISDLLFDENKDLREKIKTLEDKIESLRDENNNLKIEKIGLQNKIENSDNNGVSLSDGVSSLAEVLAPLIQAGAMKLMGVQPQPQPQPNYYANGLTNGQANGMEGNYANTFNS